MAGLAPLKVLQRIPALQLLLGELSAEEGIHSESIRLRSRGREKVTVKDMQEMEYIGAPGL